MDNSLEKGGEEAVNVVDQGLGMKAGGSRHKAKRGRGKEREVDREVREGESVARRRSRYLYPSARRDRPG